MACPVVGHSQGRARRLALALVGAALLALGGCATPGGGAPPGYYRIRTGDTLSEIAERRHLSTRKLAAWNGLKPPYRIIAGDLLRIEPPAGRVVPRQAPANRKGKRSTAPVVQSAPKGSPPASRGRVAGPVKTTARPPPTAGSGAAGSGLTWQWPVDGPLRQRYVAGKRTNAGIRIAVAPGTPVRAAADGSVVYGGSGLKGYGNLIIVRHSERFLSAYGFNQRLLAREGETVRRGQPVAESGAASNGEPLLHFEIRRDGATVDPLLYLPAR